LIDLIGVVLTLRLVWCIILLDDNLIRESSLERRIRDKIGLGWNGKKRKRNE